MGEPLMHVTEVIELLNRAACLEKTTPGEFAAASVQLQIAQETVQTYVSRTRRLEDAEDEDTIDVAWLTVACAALTCLHVTEMAKNVPGDARRTARVVECAADMADLMIEEFKKRRNMLVKT
jgi:hypothetical protein